MTYDIQSNMHQDIIGNFTWVQKLLVHVRVFMSKYRWDNFNDSLLK